MRVCVAFSLSNFFPLFVEDFAVLMWVFFCLLFWISFYRESESQLKGAGGGECCLYIEKVNLYLSHTQKNENMKKRGTRTYTLL